jgi:hypothetical protein
MPTKTQPTSPISKVTPSPNQEQPDPSDEANSTLDKVLKKFRESRKYTESGFWDTWSMCWKLYNNQRTSIGYDGNTDVFIPETYTEVQGIKAHLVNGDLEVEFLPTHPDQTGDVNVLQDLFNYAWMKDNMGQKLDTVLTEYLIVGNCYVWSYVGENGLPCQKVVSAKDCFFDVNATNYETLENGGYRYLTTLDTLKDEKIVNEEYDPSQETNDSNTEMVPRYKNLDKVGTFKDDDDDKTAKQEREELLADAVLEDMDGMVECIVYYDKEKMVTIANRTVVIEEVDTPFQREEKVIQSADNQGNPISFVMPEIKPFIPVAPFRNLIDANLWYARGDVEVIAESQERLNDVQSQKSDNLTFQLNRMWALDPNFAQKIDEIQSVPGAVFTIPPGALEQIVTAPIGADADNEIARIKSEMQAASGSNEAMPGTAATAGRQSAYQINQNLVALGARFQVKIKNLENEGMRILAQNMWKIMQIYINKEIPIRVAGADGAQWGTYNPGLFLGDYDVQIKLGASAETIKETQRQQMMQYYLLASKQPFVDQQQLFLMASTEIFDISKRQVQGLIMPPQPPSPPTIVPKLIESIEFADLYPDEQAELLSESGIQPSPLREEQTGINASPVDPNKVAKNAAILHGTPGPGAPQAMEQAGMQTAGSPPVGAPTSGVANIPKVPQA